MRDRWLLPGVLLAVCLAYANHFGNGMHFDDAHSVLDNPHIRSLANVPRFFRDATTSTVLPPNQNYRPVVTTSLAVDYALARGYAPFWYQFDAFVMFLIVVVLAFALFRVILDRAWPAAGNDRLAAFAAAIFGLHPALAETVNYVIQRAEIYATAGILGGIAAFAAWPRLRNSGLYLVPAVLAILSKQQAAVFPLLLAAYVLLFEFDWRRRDWKGLAAALAPAFAVCGAVALFVLKMTPKSYEPGGLSATAYLATQPYVWLRYFGSFFLPVHLSADSDLEPFTRANGEMAAGLLFVAVQFAATVWAARRLERRPIAFGLLWFALTLLPTSLIPLAEVENDHRMFAPFVGLSLAAVWGLVLACRAFGLVQTRPSQRIAAVLAGALLVACALGAHQRNRVWSSDEALWYDVTRKSPHNGRGLMNYGLTQMEKGRYDIALEYFNRALVLNPNYATLETNLGIAYGAQGRAAEAERHFQRSLELTPDDGSAYYFYGRYLIEAGRPQAAIPQLRRALALNPALIGARDALMNALLERGDLAGARAVAAETLRIDPGDLDAKPIALGGAPASDWLSRSREACRTRRYRACLVEAREAARLDPKAPEPYQNMGAAYGGVALWNDAVASERAALHNDPHYAPALHDLAYYTAQARHRPVVPETLLDDSFHYEQLGEFGKSIAAARTALRLRPGYAAAYNNIAAGEMDLGHWEAAIGAARRALELDPNFTLARNNLNYALARRAAATRRP